METMKTNKLWTPYRWGLITRKRLTKFASSYGKKASLRFFSRRWFAVFITTVLDTNHQETYKGTRHQKFRDDPTR